VAERSAAAAVVSERSAAVVAAQVAVFASAATAVQAPTMALLCEQNKAQLPDLSVGRLI